MSLYLIRHGETSLNVSRVIQPALTPLSERGHAQASALARRLASPAAGRALAGIVSSDLPRALQTAEHLARACGLPLATTSLLQERNFGDLRGQAYDQLGADPIRMEDAPTNGESMEQFLRRVAVAFAHVIDLQSLLGGPLAVVSHGLVIKAILLRHARPDARQLIPSSLRNGSLCILEARPPHHIEALDDTAHLEEPGLGEPDASLSGA